MFKSLLLLLACAGLGVAQDAASAVSAVRELSGAVKTGDMSWMVDKMYPSLRKTLQESEGGEEKLKVKFLQAKEAMKKAGFVVESFEVLPPAGEYDVKQGREKMVIVPTRTVFSILESGKKVKMEQKGFLYAIAKKDNPGTWYFLAGNANLNQVRDLFYDLPDNIALPELSTKPLP